MKVLSLIFPLYDFILVFRYFLFYTSLLLHSFSTMLLTIFHKCCWLFSKKTCIHFYQNISYIQALLEGIYKIHNFFSIFVANKIFKILFTTKEPIRYYYFINTYIDYQKRAFILVKFFSFSIIKLYISFI